MEHVTDLWQTNDPAAAATVAAPAPAPPAAPSGEKKKKEEERKKAKKAKNKVSTRDSTSMLVRSALCRMIANILIATSRQKKGPTTSSEGRRR
jgi:hypothetical protein